MDYVDDNHINPQLEPFYTVYVSELYSINL